MESGAGQASADVSRDNKTPHGTPEPNPQKRVACRYFGTKNGCRAGEACLYIHDSSTIHNNEYPPRLRPKGQQPGVQHHPSHGPLNHKETSSSFTEGRRFLPPPVDASRVVSKPVPKTQVDDPRAFQINQLKRRFSPSETKEDGGMALTFLMVPSDPDFPFEMAGLSCILHVPSSYPRGGQPRLDVTNEEMGRQWQAKVEKGFARIVLGMLSGTLLDFMKELDKQLEALLTDREEERITFVPNVRAGNNAFGFQPQNSPTKELARHDVKPIEKYTHTQLEAAQQRRETETRQLEARLGRASLFAKSQDGIVYTLPITPRRHEDLPVLLQIIRCVKLFVPTLYPLHNCKIELQDVNRDAANRIEKAFERKGIESKETSLMGLLNYLTQNMHVLATELDVDEEANLSNLASVQIGESALEHPFRKGEDNQSHVTTIPRPPEWSKGLDDLSNSDSDYSDSHESSDDGTDEDTQGIPLPSAPIVADPKEAPERGISFSFPSLELYGVELLELTNLNITIKCERCKDTMDLNNLRDKVIKNDSCKKCASYLKVTFRQDHMHVNLARAGYLDLEGCTVIDMLPSNFRPTCSRCSTTFPPPGLISVRGESTMSVCRECHQKMTFKIPEIKFLLVSTAARKDRAPVRKKPKESLGLVVGQELPRRGRCTHYSKSYRWFRFSCCSKVFACDRCHDEASDHPNEHANRMICGFCSREQNYRPEDCGTCRSSLIKKAGSGFWEGGKGTRDKLKMSRKDPRKYKRRPDGIPRKARSEKMGLGRNG